MARAHKLVRSENIKYLYAYLSKYRHVRDVVDCEVTVRER